MSVEGKRVLITGGTGSLGSTLVRRLLTGELGRPARLTVFSRDEAKQHELRLQYLRQGEATDDVIYQSARELLRFRIGDVRDYPALLAAVRDSEVIFHAAALKQVPTCEYFPIEAVQTNVLGAGNLVRAVGESGAPVETVVGISTDKACLDYHARVQLADGTSRAISSIVRDGASVEVRTLSEAGVTKARVTGWYKNKRAGRAMYQVAYVEGYQHVGRTCGVTLTDDHRVLTADGWKRADALQNGDRLITSEAAPNRRQMAFIVGCLLGDASLSGAIGRGGIRFGQSDRQREWLFLKQRVLQPLRAGDARYSAGRGNREPFWTTRLPAAGYVHGLREAMFSTAEKRLPRMLVQQCYAAEMLAAVYGDAGTLSDGSARLALGGFPIEDVEWLADFLTSKGMPAHAYRAYVNGSAYPEVRFTKAGSTRLFEIVGRYLPACLRHKLPEWAPPYDEAAYAWGLPVPFEGTCVVQQVYPEPRDVYCIDVEGTHNFSVGGVVVHNCKPINVMGMTKALQERVIVGANLDCPQTRFMCVRYGNVLASRGSVIPLFLEQIRQGGPLTITLPEMTRFLLTLDEAVDAVFAAVRTGLPGDTYVPRAPSALMTDLAAVLIDGREIPIVQTGIRPGEKLHEIMVSEEECHRTIERGDYYVICPVLPELRRVAIDRPARASEYSSAEVTLDRPALRRLLAPYLTGPALAASA